MQALGVLAVIVVVGVTSALGFQLSRAGTPWFWALAGLPQIAIAIIAILRARARGEARAWLAPKWGDFSRGFFGAALVFACAYVFTRVVATSGSPRGAWFARLYLQLGDPAELREKAAGLALAILVVAAAEEIAWRGLVTSLLEEKIGSRAAWVVAAFAYSLSYVPTMWSLRDAAAGLNPLLPIAALGAGLVWGRMTRAFDGRLAPAIVAHAMFDWCVVMMFRLWGTSV